MTKDKNKFTSDKENFLKYYNLTKLTRNMLRSKRNVESSSSEKDEIEVNI